MKNHYIITVPLIISTSVGATSFLFLPLFPMFSFLAYRFTIVNFFFMQPEDGSGVAGDKEKDEGRMKSVKVLKVSLKTKLRHLDCSGNFL